MTTELGAISETGGGNVYLVRYEENLWKALTPERQQHCIDTWMNQSGKAKIVSLILVPDALFPMHGHETPYLYDTYAVPQNFIVPFTTVRMAYIDINTDWWGTATEGDKLRVRREAKASGDNAVACGQVQKYRVMLGKNILDSGGRA